MFVRPYNDLDMVTAAPIGNIDTGFAVVSSNSVNNGISYDLTVLDFFSYWAKPLEAWGESLFKEILSKLLISILFR